MNESTFVALVSWCTWLKVNRSANIHHREGTRHTVQQRRSLCCAYMQIWTITKTLWHWGINCRTVQNHDSHTINSDYHPCKLSRMHVLHVCLLLVIPALRMSSGPWNGTWPSWLRCGGPRAAARRSTGTGGNTCCTLCGPAGKREVRPQWANKTAIESTPPTHLRAGGRRGAPPHLYIHTCGNAEAPINLACMCMDCGRKVEDPWGAQI